MRRLVLAGFRRPGDTRIKAELQIDDPHLWDLNDPYSYRVTARVHVAAEPMMILAEKVPRHQGRPQMACQSIGTVDVSEPAEPFVQVLEVDHGISPLGWRVPPFRERLYGMSVQSSVKLETSGRVPLASRQCCRESTGEPSEYCKKILVPQGPHVGLGGTDPLVAILALK